MNFKLYALVLVTLSCTLLASCDKQRVYEKNVAISNAVWDINERPEFEFEITDTLAMHSQYDFYINIRNTGSYANSNIYIFIDTEFPDKKIARDTVECFLADQRGKWLGKGSGSLWDNQILFKRNVIFPMLGTYKFTFQHGMRENALKEISDIGLRIEKSS